MFGKWFGKKEAPIDGIFENIADLMKHAGKKVNRKGACIQVSTGFGETLIEARPIHVGTIDGGGISHIVTVRTDLPREFSELGDERVLLINTMAAMSGLVEDPKGSLFVGNRLSVFTGDEEAFRLYTPLLGIGALLQGDWLTRQLQQATGVTKERLDLPQGDEPSAWGKKDFDHAAAALDRIGLVSTFDERGLTVEFPWESGAGSALSGDRTSLLSFDSETQHPVVGSGLFFKLQLPVKEERKELRKMATRLNAFEFNAVDAPPFFGAWCVDFESEILTHVGFWPNLLYRAGTVLNIATWMMFRNRIVFSEVVKKPTLLIVDDDQNLLECFAEALEPFYTTLLAENGAGGVAVYEQKKNAIDAVVTGINMPKMNGVEFAHYLRDKDPTLPIVVMCGHAASLTRFTHSPLAQSGLIGTMKKPFSIEDLLGELSGLLIQKREI